MCFSDQIYWQLARLLIIIVTVASLNILVQRNNGTTELFSSVTMRILKNYSCHVPVDIARFSDFITIVKW